MTEKAKVKTIVIAGSITATSNKQNGEFESKTKTVYFTTNEEGAEKLLEAGMTQYTSEDGVNFFIAKLPKTGLKVWLNKKKIKTISSEIGGDNYKTIDGLPVGICVLKCPNENEDATNDFFYRLSDINVGNKDDIEIAESNPFA